MKRQWLIFSLLFFVFLLVIAGNSQAREDVSTRLKSGGSTVTLYATADAWVDAAAPDTSYGTYDQLSAGQLNHHYRNILVLFDLSSVPAGSHIDAAYLDFYEIINLQAAGTDAGDDVLDLHASRLDGGWNETRVTWNNQPAATALGGPPTNVYGGDLWKHIDVTRIMRSLIDQGDRNYGILVSGDGVSEGAMSFYAREHGNDSRPRLRIEYTAPTATPTSTPTPNAVPPDAYRRAAQHLEEVRDTDAAPTWRHAILGEPIRPLYRPDIHGPAYYEFPVVDAADQSPLGFIIVSTGEHDYPIPHWSFVGIPITQQLEALAAEKEELAVKFYKLDALAYAAENGSGERVATLGDQPFKITGMDPAWVDNPPAVTESEWRPDLAVMDDTEADQITGTYTVTGPTPPPDLHFSAWKSWAELKAGYNDAYGVLTETLRRHASELWKAESAVRDYGHPLHKDETVTLPLLFDGPRVTMSGEGARDVRTKVIARAGLPSQLQVTVLRVHQGQTIPLKATVAYRNGVTEEINFLIVDPYRTFMPMVAQNALSMTAAAQGNEFPIGAQGVVRIDAGPWHYYYAGTDADQCWYRQIPNYESPNPYDCPSGCGATAWSMLFGWIDNQAALSSSNEYWAGRWGLFRDGARDVIAPKTWSSADWLFSALKDMTWDIRKDIGTWCVNSDNGATAPWSMDDVSDYVHGRSAIRLSTKYSVVGIGWDYIRDDAKNGIAYSDEGKHTPVVIGTGWLSHYPLAYGYRWRNHTYCVVPSIDWSCTTTTERQFFVNQGWGSGHVSWVASDIWFSGRAYPHSVWNDDVGLYGVYTGDWHFNYDHDCDIRNEFVSPFWAKPGFPIVGDFSRDHILGDIAVYEPANTAWTFDYRRNESIDEFTVWGYDDGRPFAIDCDHDGFVDDVGLYRTGDHKWYYTDHINDFPQFVSGPWGMDDDFPIAGDFDHDGYVDDVGLFRSSTGIWYYDYNHNGDTDATSGPWGLAWDSPIAGDFDKDGYIDDVGVFRPSTGMWYYDYDHDGDSDEIRGPWSWPGCIPVAGNFETR